MRLDPEGDADMPPDDEPEPLDKLSRLPRQFQIVSGNMPMPEPPRDSLPAVEHDGRLYALADLLRPLTQKGNCPGTPSRT